ncbi:MAG: flagellar basal body-associated FliL family protein [Desulfobacterales bacterium]|nr:flagellar basal body-associated FliL family protein [Desulfobacterales bacterium]
MVEEEEKETKEDEEPKTKKKSEPDDAKTGPKISIKKWIIIGVGVLFLVGGSYAVWKFLLAGKFTGKSEPQTEEIEPKAAKAKDAVKTKAEEFGTLYQMSPFIVNLFGKEGRRYLKATIELEVESDYIKKQLTQRTPQLRDAVLMLLTSKSFEDISRPDGKLRLKNELILRINQILPGSGVRALYFTEFVVQ